MDLLQGNFSSGNKMAIVKIKQANTTILMVSSLVLIFYVMLTLQAFGFISTTLRLFTPLGAGIITMFGAVWLIMETFFEGPRPKLGKDRSAQVNLGIAIIQFIFGIIITIGRPTISGIMMGILAISYLATTFFLGRELVFD